jgi:hypothetical protein
MELNPSREAYSHSVVLQHPVARHLFSLLAHLLTFLKLILQYFFFVGASCCVTYIYYVNI